MKELKSYIYVLIHIAAALCVAFACSPLQPQVQLGDKVINVGGVERGEMSIETKAVSQDADKVDWLIHPLEAGLDIVYGLDGYTGEAAHQDVAILKLTDPMTEPATYTFTYREDRRAEVGEHNQAIWYNNGFHYFQGVYVPNRIRYASTPSEVEQPGKAPGLTSDQSNGAAGSEESALGNYTLLSHYLGMPANYRLTATIERIKLPFRHRLARVVAFVLIDPELNTTLKGYDPVDGVDDPTTTSLRFCNVNVLQGVYDVGGANGHHVLTPKWTTARKVVPHFDGLRGSYSYKNQTSYDENFKFYYKEGDDGTDELYPTSTGWTAVHNASADSKGLYNGYTMINYGKVPVYDIIVRPTYTNSDNVMYDEEGYPGSKATIAAVKNVIDFEIELDNGLRYTRKFEFDLNANYQTVVYLRINREHVDYNESGAEVWEEKKQDDGWYGVDNENGNILSKAGSSWQRAYRSTTVSDDRVTDGDNYNYGENVGQYLGSTARWAELLLQAYQGGSHHGDYFILDHNITVDSKLIPKDFVFTGHLDAQDHTISLSNVDAPVYKAAESLEGLYTKAGEVYSEWSIPELYVKLETPVYYEASELEIVNGVSYVRETLTLVPEETIYYTTQEEVDKENEKHLVDYVKPAEYYSQAEIDAAKAIVNDPEYVPGSNPEAEEIATKTVEDIKTPEQTIHLGEDGYVTTYEPGYVVKVIGDVKEVIPEQYEANAESVEATVETVKRIDVTYPIATGSTVPTYPTTLEQLKTAEYYTDDHSGTRFVCPDLYQYSHNSPAYLFAGLNGTYTTAQEQAPDPYAPGVIWEANVHKEGSRWVPTAGYRAEVLNARMAECFTLFKPEAYPYTGNVQNCYNGSVHIPDNTPDIPRYK